MLTAFNNPISRYDEKTHPFSIAGYIARTPSDAPKNYIFRAPKYSVSDLLQVDDESFDKYKKNNSLPDIYMDIWTYHHLIIELI